MTTVCFERIKRKWLIKINLIFVRFLVGEVGSDNHDMVGQLHDQIHYDESQQDYFDSINGSNEYVSLLKLLQSL